MDKQPPNLTLLESSNDELLASIESLKRQLPAMEKYWPVLARHKKVQFDALVSSGFTPSQALSLIPPGLEI